MANRFHNKFHKYNHHTEKQDNIPDAGYDPIASHESPFLGDFVISPFEDAVLSAKLLNVERISAWGDDGIVIETSGAAMSLDESVISAHSDSISAYFDDTALLRGLSGQLLIEPRFSVLSGLDIAELRTRTGSFELRDTIATLWNNDGLKVNNFAGLYFTHEKGEYRDNDWRIKSFVDVNDADNNGIDFSYFDGVGWVPEMDIRRDGVSATHWFGKSANIDVIYASEQVSAASGFFLTLSANEIVGEKDPIALKAYHYDDPYIGISIDDWFGFDSNTRTITAYNGPSGVDVVVPYELSGVPVTATAQFVFSDVPLNSVTYPKGVSSVGREAYDFPSPVTTTSVAFTVNGSGQITSYDSALGGSDVVIPYRVGGIIVTGIANAAFSSSESSDLQSLVGPKTIESVDGMAFSNCSNLQSVTLPAATSIGYNAFAGTSLTSVTLPVATSVGDYAFASCGSLTSVTLPVATSIGNDAFAGTSLTSVTLPVATSVGDGAFNSCDSLTSVTLPAATSIGDSTFSYCTLLTSVTLPAATSIGDYAFAGVSLTSIDLPAATSIGNDAFAGTSLTSVTLPVATSIVDGAFYNCPLLTSVTLPVATSIGGDAFADCGSLTSIYFGGNAPTVGANVFDGVPANQVTIYVLDGTTGWGSTWGGMPVVSVEHFDLITNAVFAKSVTIQDSLIIKDTADGNYYRIQITNGILNTELVSGV